MTGRPRALQAGEEAMEYGIGREEQDAWALRSHQRYADAKKSGRFERELVAVEVPQGKGQTPRITDDESPRPDTTLEKLAKLPTIYGSPTVTPGNAPGLNTGASAVVLMARDEAERRGIKPLATIVGWAMLERAKLTLDDMDLIEVNEAFAAVPLVATFLMAGRDRSRAERIREKTNVDGGAIAIGHPTGATGARLALHLVFELQRRRAEAGAQRPYYGLATICGGIGEGEALVVRVDG